VHTEFDGTVQAPFTNPPLDRDNQNVDRFPMFRIERVGTAINYYFREKLVYTSLVASNTALCAEFFTISSVSYFNQITFKMEHDDIFGEFGNSTLQTGRFDPNFFAVLGVDGSNFSLQIDGAEAIKVADYDYSTTLSAGEISVWPREGVVRLSSSDIGKTITTNYTYLKNA
jgi:hypothetical protein